ncbi:hypothetical protein AWC38_SpisGene12501 [Stylophora pistillata]|uniref:Uncharacterized protein n=2 Tax=Stylophora pistillata TaxID=50429 RepID=A0A2B4RWX2_STYPI|nr:hypothetical protein AWC38_SpisGene12501 [Stylophora pistillata]
MLRSNRRLALVAVLMVSMVYGIGYGLIPIFDNCRVTRELLPVRNDLKHACLRNAFSDIVLVIVYNYPFYSSIPLLSALYKNAFPTIMFCGPKKSRKHNVEALEIHRGYFSYRCMSRAIEKHPGRTGYLLISDDVLLNYWNLVDMDRDKIWEGAKIPVKRNNTIPENWFWWNSEWGKKACQEAYNEIWALRELFYFERLPEMSYGKVRSSKSTWNIEESINILKDNGNGTFPCFRGRSDIFYIPGKFADAFKTLSYIFYKHRSFLEIAVPTMCRMLDRAEKFEYIPGIYMPGYSKDKQSERFWRLYDKTLAFIHSFKLHYKHDGALNKALLRRWIIDYSDSLSKC